MVKPTLKWPGGKRQLLDSLHTVRPDSFDTYWEPFLGGGALAFDLAPDDFVVNDLNQRLMNYYRVVRDQPDALLDTLRSFADPESDPVPDRQFADTSHTGASIEQYYYQQRAHFNKRPYGYDWDPVTEAALLQYLNRTCYNGLYRENQSGGFNAPIGRYDNPDWVQADRVWALSDALQNAQLRCDDYQAVVADATAGDFVYLDPPYQPMSETADFTEYTASGFDRNDQQTLCETARALADDGVHVVVTNSAVMAPLYREADFTVHTVDATRSINSDPDGRDAVEEIIAVGGIQS